MGQISITIVKRTAFRDSVQEFSNTYTYTSIGLNPSTTLAQDNLIDEIVTQEKILHSSAVTFVRASLWSSGGTKAENNMLRQRTLSGVGSASIATSFDKERAVLVQWAAGKDSKGRPVKLRKWFHCCGQFGDVSFAATALDNTTQISLSQRTRIEELVNPLTEIGVGPEVWRLCAPSGRLRENDSNAVAHKYLEHHQLGDMWRG